VNDGVLAPKHCAAFLFVDSRCINLPLDQDWTKVIKTVLNADLLFVLLPPLG